MTETEYDRLFNETGEGFNPYRKQNDNSSEPMWSKVDNRISKLQRLLNGMSDTDDRRVNYEAEKVELESL